ncbi:hypothetical protein Tco_0917701 [Tanacetum coccineum]
MNDTNITMEEYIRLEEEKAPKRGKVFNWETTKYGKIWYDEDLHDLRSVETEFPAISFNDEVSSEKTLSCEPTDNDDDKVDIEHSSRDLSVKPLPDLINTDVGAYAHGTVDTAYSLNEYSVFDTVIMEYLVNISKRRAFWSLNEDILKINDSDYQYAVSIKEDTAYPCLHSPKTTKETSSIRRIQRRPIRRIKDIVCEDSGRYQA